jgi:flagellar motor switch protein FliM
MTQLPGGKLESDVIRRITSRLGQGRPGRDESVVAVDYDWRQCHHYGPAAVTQVNEVVTKAASAIADKLTDLFHARPEIAIASMEQCFAGEAIEAASAGGAWVMNFSRQKGKNCGTLSINPAAAIKWVAQLLGDDSSKHEEGKELSELEQTLLLDMAFAVGQSFAQAVGAAKGAAIVAETQLSKGANAQMDKLADACRITLSIKTAADSSTMDIVLLCDVLDPIVGMA